MVHFSFRLYPLPIVHYPPSSYGNTHFPTGIDVPATINPCAKGDIKTWSIFKINNAGQDTQKAHYHFDSDLAGVAVEAA